MDTPEQLEIKYYVSKHHNLHIKKTKNDNEEEKQGKIWVISNKLNKFEVPILKRI
jgi:hypothetical protein